MCYNVPLSSQVCEEELVQNCSIVAVPVSRQLSQVECVQKTVPKCVVNYETVCTGSKVDSYKPYECKKVRRENCQEVSVQVLSGLD